MFFSHHNVRDLVFLQGLREESGRKRQPAQPRASYQTLQKWRPGFLLWPWPWQPRPKPHLPQVRASTSVGGSSHSNPGRTWLAAQSKHTQNNLSNVTKALAKPQFKLWAENGARTCISKPRHPPCISTGPGRFQHFGKKVAE